jgi:SAM-dependent methyltransferase
MRRGEDGQPGAAVTVSVVKTRDGSRPLVRSETSPTDRSQLLAERIGMSTRWRLLTASTLMLFLELALIRWLGAEVLHLSYFSNFVLLGSFLGIGLGFLRAAGPAHRDRPLPFYSPVALLGLVGFVSAYPVTVDRSGHELIFFSSLSTTGPPIWLTLPAVFLAVATVLAGPGELVGACFRVLPRLEAYRLDLLGSLLGIAAFTGLAFLDAPPLVWFVIVALLYIVLLGRPAVSVTVTLLVAIVLLFGYPLRHEKGQFWSPYYRVDTQQVNDAVNGRAWEVNVNGVPHQLLVSAAVREKQGSYYLEPYARVPHTPRNVLIVGAGTGTDVAVALRQGVQHVDAVEIDPTLLRFGRQHSPDAAYADPRVTAHVDDGRAFLERTSTRYDLILFALPDSLTLVSGASSLRLESYLFTEQAVRAARDHLAPGGAFSMYNYYREHWLVDRLAGTVDGVFGHPPCIFDSPKVPNFAVLVAGLAPADQQCQATWQRPASVVSPSTDDKPFLYLENSTIPSLYTSTLGLVLIVSVLAVLAVLLGNAMSTGKGALRRLAGDLRGMWLYRDLFLLGAAFLLLETKSVTGFALLFGTTWIVNSLVFAGILLAVLGAVELTRRGWAPPLVLAYGVLLASLAVSWLVPTSWLLSLPVPVRAVVAIVIAFLPITAANVIFARRFRATADAPLAFGTNLLGAMLGGALEYLSLVYGYHALLVIAAALYAAAYLIMPQAARRA